MTICLSILLKAGKLITKIRQDKEHLKYQESNVLKPCYCIDDAITSVLSAISRLSSRWSRCSSIYQQVFLEAHPFTLDKENKNREVVAVYMNTFLI